MPPRMRRAYVDTRIGQLHVARAGAGDPVVLLPAASQSHHQMRQLMRHLSADFDVMAIDMPGSGYSDPLPPGASFAMLADAVAEAIDGLGLARPAVYGIHTGNKIAACLAARHPDKVGALILCGQTHSLVADMAARTERMKAVSANRFQPAARDPAAAQLGERLAFWRELETHWWRGGLAAGTASPHEIEEAGYLVADLVLSVASLPDLYKANFAYDLEADLRRLAAPTLIVEIATAHEDRTIGRQGQALQAIMPGASLLTFEEPDGLGLTLENRAETLSAAIRSFVRQAGQSNEGST